MVLISSTHLLHCDVMKMKPAQDRCPNCGIRFVTLLIDKLADNHKKILAQWLQQLPEGGKICKPCFTKIKKCGNFINPPRAVGHEAVCSGCGQSVLSRKRHKAYQRDGQFPLLYPEYKQYYHYKTGQYFLCYDCQTRFSRAIKKSENSNDKTTGPNTDTETSDPGTKVSIEDPTIYNTQVAKFENNFLILPGYQRPSLRNGKCIVPKCCGTPKLLSRAERKLIFLQTNTLLLRRTSLCEQHAPFNNLQKFGFNNFNVNAVEEALSMCEKPIATIDFDRIHDMPDNLCKYWTGLTVEEFKDLYEKLNVDNSAFHSLRNALAVHLLRQKTGDSIIKLANLFLMSNITLSKQLKVIEKCFNAYNSNLQRN